MINGRDSQASRDPHFRRFNAKTVRMYTMFALDIGISDAESAKPIVTEWVRRHALRMGGRLGEVAGEQFELDRLFEHQLLAAAIASADGSQWAARLQHSQDDDVSRVWRTDVGISNVDGQSNLSVRVGYTGVLDRQVSRKAPTFLHELVRNGISLFDGDELDPEPWIVASEEDVSDVLELIADDQRTLPVIVLAAPPFTSPALLAKQALGVAHVIGVPAAMIAHFNHSVTFPWAVRAGSVRTFFPNFDLAADSTVLAPAARSDTINNWIFEDTYGPIAFMEYLLDVCAANSVTTRRHSPALTVSDIRSSNLGSRAAELAEAARSQVNEEDGERLKRLEAALAGANDEINALRTSAQEAREEHESLSFKLDELDAFLKDIETSETDARRAMHSLSHQNRNLIEALRAAGSPIIDVPILDDLDDVEAWVIEHFSGRLVLTTRALRGVGKNRA
jgi:hypothetical protein